MQNHNTMKTKRTVLILLTVAVLVVTACSGKDRPVSYEPGTEKCTYCMMLIVDNRYRAQVITDKGKIHHFDAIECMLAWSYEQPEKLKSMWVSDYYQPGKFINLDKAEIITSEEINSPMGANLAAVEKSDATRLIKEKNGRVLHNDELKKYIHNWNSQKMQRHSH